VQLNLSNLTQTITAVSAPSCRPGTSGMANMQLRLVAEGGSLFLCNDSGSRAACISGAFARLERYADF
jgi:hypothetical protein